MQAEQCKLQEQHGAAVQSRQRAISALREVSTAAQKQTEELKGQVQAAQNQTQADLQEAASRLKEAQDQTAKAALEASHQARDALEASFSKANSQASDQHKLQCQVAADATLQVESLQSKLVAVQEELADSQQQLHRQQAEVQALKAQLDGAQAESQAQLDEQHAMLTQQLQEASCGLQQAQQQAADEVSKLQEEQAWLRQKLSQTEASLQEKTAGLEEAGQQRDHACGEVTRLTEKLQSASKHNEEQATAIVQLSDIAKRQRARLASLQAEQGALQQKAALHNPEASARLQGELARLQGLVNELSGFRELAGQETKQKQAAEKEVERLRPFEQRCKASEDRAAQLQEKLQEATDACKVKTAMVDSAQKSVQELKAAKAHVEQALAEAQHEIDNRDADEARRLHDLKEELRAHEQAAKEMEVMMDDAKHDAMAAQARVKHMSGQLKDKDEMLAFVSEEVERLKGMFTSKEQRLVSEREAALTEHEAAKREADTLRVKLQAAEQRADGMSSEGVAAKEALQAAERTAEAHKAEAVRLTLRLKRVESDMQQRAANLALSHEDRRLSASAKSILRYNASANQPDRQAGDPDLQSSPDVQGDKPASKGVRSPRRRRSDCSTLHLVSPSGRLPHAPAETRHPGAVLPKEAKRSALDPSSPTPQKRKRLVRAGEAKAREASVGFRKRLYAASPESKSLGGQIPMDSIGSGAVLSMGTKDKAAPQWVPIRVSWSDAALAVSHQRRETRHNVRRQTCIYNLQRLQELASGCTLKLMADHIEEHALKSWSLVGQVPGVVRTVQEAMCDRLPMQPGLVWVLEQTQPLHGWLSQLVLDTRISAHLLGHITITSTAREANCVFVEAELPSLDPNLPAHLYIFLFTTVPVRAGVPLLALGSPPSCPLLTSCSAKHGNFNASPRLLQQLEADQVGSDRS
ncbi:hypothetical protein WJX73_009941 [Symbiochloris irregularis]|uniref:Uncharacterized protein n=1 Tax=Symbiochloris irregularis TaxID=706552 RepID=A0AAW1PIE5_9CHLO